MHRGKMYTVYIPEFRTPIEPQRKILDPIAEIVTEEAKDEACLISIMRTVDAALLTQKTRMTRTVIEACANLKVISKYGVGYEGIDIEAATDMGIPVMNTPGVNTNAVAEFTVGLILALLRRIQEAKEYLKGGGWKDDRFLGAELSGSSIGIIGYGKIAKQVIRILQGFEVRKILIFSDSRTNEIPEFSNAEFVDLQTLLKESRVVSIHKSLTERSKGLIGEHELRLMRNESCLINTSRGSLIEENALTRALREGWIAGAALDVFEREPLDRDNPLVSLDNVVLTPHIGGVTLKARQKMVTTAAKNIVDVLDGKPDLQCIVNPEVFAGE
jgi:phosphoglycerate dehydrogenase-like enzyme